MTREQLREIGVMAERLIDLDRKLREREGDPSFHGHEAEREMRRLNKEFCALHAKLWKHWSVLCRLDGNIATALRTRLQWSLRPWLRWNGQFRRGA